MKTYLLLLREGDEEYEQLSPRKIEALMKRYFEWNAKLREAGAHINCIKLNEGPGLLARGRPALPGDAAAAGEIEISEVGAFVGGAKAVAGLFLIRAADANEARAYAAGCPILEYGGSAEIREVFSLFDPAGSGSSSDKPSARQLSGEELSSEELSASEPFADL